MVSQWETSKEDSLKLPSMYTTPGAAGEGKMNSTRHGWPAGVRTVGNYEMKINVDKVKVSRKVESDSIKKWNPVANHCGEQRIEKYSPTVK